MVCGKQDMIIINLTGGLGNQMFQYAFGRYLSIKNKTELKYHFTNALFNTQRHFALNVFNIAATEATPADLKAFGIVQNRYINRIFYLLAERFGINFNYHIVTQRYPYTFEESLRETMNNRYIQGFFADERYFKGIETILDHDFTPLQVLDSMNLKIIKEIKKHESVSVHIRRGDFITYKSYIGDEYYKTAVKKIQNKIKEPFFYFFSDEIDWCKKNFSFLKNVRFIDNNQGKKAYLDLVLMSYCKHNIIANSTFSWWGAKLNHNKKSILISPR